MATSSPLLDLPSGSSGDPGPRPPGRPRRGAGWAALALGVAGVLAAVLVARPANRDAAPAPVAAAPAPVASAFPPAPAALGGGCALGDVGGMAGVLPESARLASGRPVIGDWTGLPGVLPDAASMASGYSTATEC